MMGLAGMFSGTKSSNKSKLNKEKNVRFEIYWKKSFKSFSFTLYRRMFPAVSFKVASMT